MARSPLFFASTVALMAAQASGALVFHASLDDATVAGGGSASTSAGGFAVASETGAALTARANAHSGSGTSTTGSGYHVTAGHTGLIGQAIGTSNPNGTTNPSSGNGGLLMGSMPAPGLGSFTISLWFNALGQTQGTINGDGSVPDPATGSGFLFSSGPNATGSANEGLVIALTQPTTPGAGRMRALVRASSGLAGDAGVESGGGVAGSTLGPDNDDHRASMSSADFSLDSEWHLITMVLDVSGTTAELRGYLDGNLFANVGGSGPADNFFLLDSDGLQSNTSNPRATLGVRAGSSTTNNYSTMQNFRGLIDDVAMWDEALTPAQIQQIHAGGLAGLNAPAALAVPEPGSLLLAAAGVVLLRRRRRA